MKGRALLVLVALASAGCFRVDVYAPHGPPVRLLSRDEQTSVKRVRRTWFAILGITRIDEVMPAHLVHNEALEEVRIRVTDTIPDALIGLANTVLLQVGVLAQTYEVLGNRGKDGEPAAGGAIGTRAAPSGPSQPAGPQPE